MTCGRCHRDADDHPASSSGPTRCQYQTHRAECPGTFSTKCSDHLVGDEIAPPDTSVSEKDASIRKLEEQLQKLKLEQKAEVTTTPSTPAHTVPHTPQSVAGPTTWGQMPPNLHQTSQEGNLSNLGDIEKMVRDHVANNQQFLQSQPSSQGQYSGPTIAQIRRDPQVQTQADLIMNQIKNSLPIFGQNIPAQNQPLSGISPLGQGAAPHPTALPTALPTAHPTDTQLLIQKLSQDLQHQLTQQGLQQRLQMPQPDLLRDFQRSLPGITTPLQTQPQLWSAQPPSQATSMPPSLVSALNQLGPNIATPILQAFQQQQQLNPAPQMWNLLGSQQQSLLPQQQQPLPGLYSQQHHQGLYGYPPTVPVAPHSQGLFQGFQQVAPQATPVFQKPSSSTPQQQGMSSMTGISFLRPTEYTKYCQVEYAKKAKPENCNLVLYVWGYVAQILASKQGLISAMPEQEQIGRLQHLLHVLELCAMQSSPTDFNSSAWLCARNYSDRVYQDLDIGATSWSQIGTKMHPTNLMQAMSTHPKRVQEKPPPQLPKPGDATTTATTTGPVCPKWSACEDKDKCTWEVENPGRSCNRPHFCTFCQKKSKQVRKHKDTDCRKKAEQTGTGSDQPTC